MQAFDGERTPGGGAIPTPEQAADLSRALLAGNGTRLRHVHQAGTVAQGLAVLFTPEEHRLLVAAAALHDIGYAPELAHTGFHPLDGGTFLSDQGYSPRLAGLVAHHSHAQLLAPDDSIRRLLRRFPDEESLLSDALAYSDMHSHPSGAPVLAEDRIADINRRHQNPRAYERMGALQASIDRVRSALALGTGTGRSRA